MALVSVSWCVCMSMCVMCVYVFVCILYLMTNRIEGSEQSGLNDYIGNKGERLIGRERKGKKRDKEGLQNQQILTLPHKTENIASVCWSCYPSFSLSFWLCFLHSLYLFSSRWDGYQFFIISSCSTLFLAPSPFSLQSPFLLFLSIFFLHQCLCNTAINYSCFVF